MQRQPSKSSGRAVKQQGWEEAGNEFYQEAFNVNSDERKRNSKNDSAFIQAQLATLLPSKQFTTIDTRTWGKAHGRTVRRRMSTRRRRSSLLDVEQESLPDLTDEDLANEEETWNRIQEIRSLPVDMATKRDLRAQLLHAPTFRLKGLAALQMKRRKLFKSAWDGWSELWDSCLPWQSSIRHTEANYGAGTASFFSLIRWLFALNLAMTSLIVIFVAVPWEVGKQACTSDSAASSPRFEVVDSNPTSWNTNSSAAANFLEEENETDEILKEIPQFLRSAFDYSLSNCNGGRVNTTTDATQQCWENYRNSVQVIVQEHAYRPLLLVQDFVQGTGWMQLTAAFYGYFPPAILTLDNSLGPALYYHMSLAYLAAMLAGLLLSVVSMTRSVAKGFRLKLRAGEVWRQRYSDILFTSWDFCINNCKVADLKHKAIFQEIRALQAADRIVAEKASRTRREKVRLYFLRAAINSFVLMVLTLSGYVIYLVSQASLGSADLIVEYAPPIVITTLNFFVPKVFSAFTKWERYAPSFEIKIILFRTVFLRLASVVVLMSTLYVTVVSGTQHTKPCEQLELQENCWETYVGQQIYKLCIFDCIVILASVFLVEWPMMAIGRQWATRKPSSWFAKWNLHQQEFDLATHTLDLVYSQTLCWLGMFYCPALPLMTAVKCIITFYVKRFSCVYNCVPPTRLYQASRSSAFFMNVLLLSFVGSALPIGYAVSAIPPSQSCGPFRGLVTAWNIVVQEVGTLPSFWRNFIYYFGTAGFFVPALLTLILSLYYYVCLSQAHRELVLALRSQLELEGKDKQFLLSKLASLTKLDQSRGRLASRPE